MAEIILLANKSNIFLVNSTPRNWPTENCMGLITCYIEIARGKVK